MAPPTRNNQRRNIPPVDPTEPSEQENDDIDEDMADAPVPTTSYSIYGKDRPDPIYFDKFVIENEMIMDKYQPTINTKWSSDKLEDDGGNWNLWERELKDRSISNRLAEYTSADIGTAIHHFPEADTDSFNITDQRLFYLHRERMMHLKNLIKGSLSRKNQTLVLELDTPYDILQRLTTNYLAKAEYIKRTLMQQWMDLDFASYKSWTDYISFERNLIDKIVKTNAGSVSEDDRKQKLTRHMPATPSAQYALSTIVTTGKNWSLSQIQEHIQGLVLQFGNESFFGKSGNKQKKNKDEDDTAVNVTTSSLIHTGKGCTKCRASKSRYWKTHSTGDCRASHTKPKKEKNPKDKSLSAMKGIRCFNCNKVGHKALNCRAEDQTRNQAYRKKTTSSKVGRTGVNAIESTAKDLEPAAKQRKVDKDPNAMYVVETFNVNMIETYMIPLIATSSPNEVLSDRESRNVQLDKNVEDVGQISNIRTSSQNNKRNLKAYLAIVDSGSEHSFFSDAAFFPDGLTAVTVIVRTVVGSDSNLVQGEGRVSFILENNVVINIEKAYYMPSNSANILSLTDLSRACNANIDGEGIHMLVDAAPMNLKWNEKRFTLKISPFLPEQSTNSSHVHHNSVNRTDDNRLWAHLWAPGLSRSGPSSVQHHRHRPVSSTSLMDEDEQSSGSEAASRATESLTRFYPDRVLSVPDAQLAAKGKDPSDADNVDRKNSALDRQGAVVQLSRSYMTLIPKVSIEEWFRIQSMNFLATMTDLPSRIFQIQILHPQSPDVRFLINDNEVNELVHILHDDQMTTVNRILIGNVDWHARLGHPSTSTLRRLIQSKGISDSIDQIQLFLQQQQSEMCVACLKGKSHRQPFSETTYREFQILERLDIDIIGPINPPSNKFKYVLTMVDRRSRKSAIALLTSKNEAFEKILTLLFKLKHHHPGNPIKILRLDNAGEFKSERFTKWCNANGISLEYSPPYEHESNGMVESFNKKITTIARTLVAASNLTENMWYLAFLHANEIANIHPHKALDDKSPFEVFYGAKPSVTHLRPFGCECWRLIPPELQRKIGPRVERFVYVGT